MLNINYNFIEQYYICKVSCKICNTCQKTNTVNITYKSKRNHMYRKLILQNIQPDSPSTVKSFALFLHRFKL